MRWLVVSPQKDNECMLALVKADTAEKQATVGKQAPGHVLVVFETDDIQKSYQEMKKLENPKRWFLRICMEISLTWLNLQNIKYDMCDIGTKKSAHFF